MKFTVTKFLAAGGTVILTEPEGDDASDLAHQAFASAIPALQPGDSLAVTDQLGRLFWSHAVPKPDAVPGDTLVGGAGNDSVFGELGDDSLSGNGEDL